MARSIQVKVSKQLRKNVLGTSNEYVEGTMKVIPNCEYRTNKIFDIDGVGEIFVGAYYLKKVRHIFNNGYSVECDIIKISEDGYLIPPDPTLVDAIVLTEFKDESGEYLNISVMSGDTISAIASKYKSTVTTLATLNNLADPNKIYVGQIIKVPKS